MPRHVKLEELLNQIFLHIPNMWPEDNQHLQQYFESYLLEMLEIGLTKCPNRAEEVLD